MRGFQDGHRGVPAPQGQSCNNFCMCVNIDDRRSSIYMKNIERVEINMTADEIIEISGKRLIRLSTFAKEMDLHIRTIQLWAKEHDMPVIRVGNQMLLDL